MKRLSLTFVSFVPFVVSLSVSPVSAQSASLDCIHYRNDYRRPYYCDPRPPEPAPQIIIIAPQQQQQQQIVPPPRHNIRDLHRRGIGGRNK